MGPICKFFFSSNLKASFLLKRAGPGCSKFTLNIGSNDNPISTFPPCYAFQMIFTAWAPSPIQYISRNVHNKNGHN